MRLRLQNHSDGSQIGVHNAAPRSYLQTNYGETFRQTKQAIKLDLEPLDYWAALAPTLYMC